MTANHQVRVPGLLLPHLPSAEGGWEGREHQGDPVEADGRPHQKVPGSQQPGEPQLFLLENSKKKFLYINLNVLW